MAGAEGGGDLRAAVQNPISSLYGLPYATEAIALYYNADLVPEPPATFEEMTALCDALEGIDNCLGIPGGADDVGPAAYHHYPWVSVLGGYIFNFSLSTGYDTSDVGLDTEEAIGVTEGLDLIASLSYERYISDGDFSIVSVSERDEAPGLVNFHVIAITLSGRAVEELYLDVVTAVRDAVSIPLALKLSPYFSSVGDMARQFDAAGADALVLFNRLYRPDFDLERLQVVPRISLSTPAEIRLPLLWISLLHGRIEASLAASHGVDSAAEVIKYLLAGADAVMTTSALLRHGVEHLATLVEGLREWMHHKDYASVRQMQGVMSQQHTTDPDAFERANYIKTLEHYGNEPVPGTTPETALR